MARGRLSVSFVSIASLVMGLINGVGSASAMARRGPSDSCGPTWTVVPSPSPGNQSNGLSGVAALSSSDAWAVGTTNSFNGHTVSEPLLLHWDGIEWTQVSSNSSGDNNVVNDVAAISPSDVWVVGDNENGPYGEHWDGMQWREVEIPSERNGGNLLGVSASSSTDVWAVGYHYNAHAHIQMLIEHWNGTAWSIVPNPPIRGVQKELFDVVAVSADDAWAVGDVSNGGADYRTLVIHWNGTTWTRVRSRNADGASTLHGIAANASGDLVAAGYATTPTATETLVERWNGKVFRSVSSRNTTNGDDYLYGITIDPSGQSWAVGTVRRKGHSRTLIEHSGGHHFRLQDSPDPGGNYINQLWGATVSPDGDAWAVGGFASLGQPIQSLTMHLCP